MWDIHTRQGGAVSDGTWQLLLHLLYSLVLLSHTNPHFHQRNKQTHSPAAGPWRLAKRLQLYFYLEVLHLQIYGSTNSPQGTCMCMFQHSHTPSWTFLSFCLCHCESFSDLNFSPTSLVSLLSIFLPLACRAIKSRTFCHRGLMTFCKCVWLYSWSVWVNKQIWVVTSSLNCHAAAAATQFSAILSLSRSPHGFM